MASSSDSQQSNPGPSVVEVRNPGTSNPSVEVDITLLENDVPHLGKILQLNRLKLIPEEVWRDVQNCGPAADRNFGEVERQAFEEKESRLNRQLQKCRHDLEIANQKIRNFEKRTGDLQKSVTEERERSQTDQRQIQELQAQLKETENREEKLQIDLSTHQEVFDDIIQSQLGEEEVENVQTRCAGTEEKLEEVETTDTDLQWQFKIFAYQLLAEKVLNMVLAQEKEKVEKKWKDEISKRINDAIRMKDEKESLMQEKFRFLAFLRELISFCNFPEEIGSDQLSTDVLHRISEHIRNLLKTGNDCRVELEKNRDLFENIVDMLFRGSSATGTRSHVSAPVVLGSSTSSFLSVSPNHVGVQSVSSTITHSRATSSTTEPDSGTINPPQQLAPLDTIVVTQPPSESIPTRDELVVAKASIEFSPGSTVAVIATNSAAGTTTTTLPSSISNAPSQSPSVPIIHAEPQPQTIVPEQPQQSVLDSRTLRQPSTESCDSMQTPSSVIISRKRRRLHPVNKSQSALSHPSSRTLESVANTSPFSPELSPTSSKHHKAVHDDDPSTPPAPPPCPSEQSSSSQLEIETATPSARAPLVIPQIPSNFATQNIDPHTEDQPSSSEQGPMQTNSVARAPPSSTSQQTSNPNRNRFRTCLNQEAIISTCSIAPPPTPSPSSTSIRNPKGYKKRAYQSRNQYSPFVNTNKLHGDDKDSSRYKCLCNRYFDSQQLLDIHIRKMTTEWKYPCDKCHQYFFYLRDMQKHRKRCRKIARSPDSSATNAQTEQVRRDAASADNESIGHPQQTQQQVQAFASSSAGDIHRRSRARQAENKRRANLRKLQQEFSKRKKHAPWVSRKGTVQGNWYCQCFQKFSSKAKLHYHIIYWTSDWKFKCDHCPRKFFYLNYLKSHLINTHKVADPLNKFSAGCYICGMKFQKRDEYYIHKKVVHNIQSPRNSKSKPSIVIRVQSSQAQPSGSTGSSVIAPSSSGDTMDDYIYLSSDTDDDDVTMPQPPGVCTPVPAVTSRMQPNRVPVPDYSAENQGNDEEHGPVEKCQSSNGGHGASVSQLVHFCKCGNKFLGKAALMSHCTYMKYDLYVCIRCSGGFKQLRDLITHIGTEHNDKFTGFKCGLCEFENGLTFMGGTLFKEHCSLEHQL